MTSVIKILGQQTPKRLAREEDIMPMSPPIKDVRMFPWNWGDGARRIQLSPASSCESTESQNSAEIRRGRPRLDAISSLILEGSSSASPIRCNVCNRVFPREKSLQAHLRTHTGERPYLCDYPGCDKAFAQSGQLKTHQRLHTGEKPFRCSAQGCQNTFTHANRHCTKHPTQPLLRDETSNGDVQNNENRSEAVTRWLEKYYRDRREKSTTTKLRERKLHHELDAQQEADEKNRGKRFCREEMPDGASCDQQERMLGAALALIQLAASPVNSMSSPLDLSANKKF